MKNTKEAIRLESLEREHNALNKEVAAIKTPGCDKAALASLKRRKLELKDCISNLRTRLAMQTN